MKEKILFTLLMAFSYLVFYFLLKIFPRLYERLVTKLNPGLATTKIFRLQMTVFRYAPWFLGVAFLIIILMIWLGMVSLLEPADYDRAPK